ncbi:MAG: TauD/TfdA family dioxygenase [Novosphingobium sp.]|nr:TauD/TfdA family dioxygenase [Novosphingobium sp.]
MADVKIRELGPELSFGSRVTGMSWDNIEDEDLRQQMRELFIERGVIVFEDMEPSPTLQVELSKIFGPLKDHPTKSTPRADPSLDPGIIDMEHKRDDMAHDHGLTEVNGKKVHSFIPWHFDHTYNDELNYAGVLRAVVVAPEAGRTGFADGIQIFNALDPELIRRIEDLSVLYTLDVRITQMKYGRYFKTFGDMPAQAGLIAEAAIFPRAIHPMIWTRPTGERVAHFCGFSAEGVELHEDPEGDALIEEALQKMYKAIKPYWHQWKTTDMVIWDNHRVLHSVEGCDPKYPRRMHRTTVKGDYDLGRFEHGKKVGEVQREITPLALPA